MSWRVYFVAGFALALCWVLSSLFLFAAPVMRGVDLEERKTCISINIASITAVILLYS
jgi:hypothetical protein